MKLKNFKYLDIIIDNPNSWMWKYTKNLEEILKKHAQYVRFFKNVNEIEYGDVMFILSCNKILKEKDLIKHINNIVIHASDLPKGKGWSPWTWEIENGAKFLTLTLFEASLKLDSGDWYLKDKIILNGGELINSLRKLIAEKEFEMINNYLSQYPLESKKYIGKESFYNKRDFTNQELDITKTIQEQFNKLRVCDNNDYPAYFYKNGKKYLIQINEQID